MINRLLLQNGLLFTGTGITPLPGHVLIEDRRIAAVGSFEPSIEIPILDCTGLAISPGFVDAHSHSDLQVLEGRMEKINQGVTTEVVGNCGFSVFPAALQRKPLHEFADGILCGTGDWGWRRPSDYLALASRRSKVHVASLVGHGSLRLAVAGNRQGPLGLQDLDTLRGLLEDCLSDGACGFSSGLMYAPGCSAPREELEMLCRAAARADKIYACHLRDYAAGLVGAVEEQIDLARRSGCRLQISHLQAVGARNWDQQEVALTRIERARAQGIDVAFDCYPYVAGSTVLTQWLPQWALEGGLEAMLGRLQDQHMRARIRTEILASLAQDWSDLYVSAVATEANQGLIGQHWAAIAEQRSRPPADLVLDLLTEERGAIQILEFNQSEENLRALLAHPLSIVVSDSFYVHGRPHPRLYGAFPLLLGEICRRKKWLNLPEAILKITDRPARRYGIRERGRLEVGFFADLVVFDPETIDSPATYAFPKVAPTGIRWVLHQGKIETKHNYLNTEEESANRQMRERQTGRK